MIAWTKRMASLAMLASLLVLQGCATVQTADARDPWESMNRSVYQFNEVVDTVAIKPAAQLYVKALPSFVRTGVSNFLGNLGDVWSMANSALQLKGQATVETFMRIHVNTFLGLGGLLDVATEMRLEKRKEDFGQTLGHWGVKPGPYVVLPLLGPSTLRDSLALPLDMQGDASQRFSDEATRNALTATRILDIRSGLLQTVDVVKAASLDPYSFVRDGYLQKRRNDIYDGNPPSSFDYGDGVSDPK
ncbi:MlaA family lipoprotein [Limnohabitans sp. 63ED37-2]|uniref:MlaA family lipoprotein n=1 Tax=Limnohabitans sp. 63ED37-2 TaxID=1678128 RepID=UPI0007059109|nr:VacJ family lipoprotein [Limnohabitans sp. 63ED37-2]ALK89799.1 putative phospholipid-binding lipoprotein MlaA precursor [Limnohabitans sp. 63ED37-2]